MDLIDLEPFVSVVDHRSVVGPAADQLPVTRMVQDLEDALWTPLFDRHTRPLQPAVGDTEAYEFTRPALSLYRRSECGYDARWETCGRFSL